MFAVPGNGAVGFGFLQPVFFHISVKKRCLRAVRPIGRNAGQVNVVFLGSRKQLLQRGGRFFAHFSLLDLLFKRKTDIRIDQIIRLVILRKRVFLVDQHGYTVRIRRCGFAPVLCPVLRALRVRFALIFRSRCIGLHGLFAARLTPRFYGIHGS
ncbi:hypothetical protein D1872_274700 [compost metagenome]